MTQLNYQLPILGQGNASEDPKVHDALAEIQTVVNGELGSDNLQDASITLADLIGAVQHALLQPGDLKVSAVATPQTGWLLCDGSPVSRTTYSVLFATIGTTNGTGDGTTTFNVPDLRGRFPLGAGTGTGLTARALGAKGGDENYSGNVLLQGGAGPFFASILTGAGPGFNADTGSGGGGASQMPPFQVVNWFIFTGQ